MGWGAVWGACAQSPLPESPSPPPADLEPAAARTAEIGGPYPWIADQGDGTYRNPVVFADYSDPDVIRVGADYYLVASSFHVTPALPILRSRDLVNWTLAGHALAELPHPRFAAVQPGAGVWAPAWREHAGVFYLFFPMPDEGIYLLTANSPTGPWSTPHLVAAGKGLIDPCPFWDDDGRAYLVHAYAKSRSGIKSKLRLVPMAPDGTHLLGDGQIVFDGTLAQPTIEGPKMYKRGRWYYILAPAGGVPAGWQVALRAQDIWGPYEERVVLRQGPTRVNGPHQGALIDSPDGRQWWFVHFQDMGVYGRVVHLNPVTWADDWPLMGVADPGTPDGRVPVLRYPKPVPAPQKIAAPETSDEFEARALGLQWQWNANHRDDWYSLTARPSYLRMTAVPLSEWLDPAATTGPAEPDLSLAPHLLLQKFPARSFAVETAVDIVALRRGARAGLIVAGKSYAALAASPGAGLGDPSVTITLIVDGKPLASEKVGPGEIRLRVVVADGGVCRFSYGRSDGTMGTFPTTFQAMPGVWIGARVGLFASSPPLAPASFGPQPAPGHADFPYFRFSAR